MDFWLIFDFFAGEKFPIFNLIDLRKKTFAFNDSFLGFLSRQRLKKVPQPLVGKTEQIHMDLSSIKHFRTLIHHTTHLHCQKTRKISFLYVFNFGSLASWWYRDDENSMENERSSNIRSHLYTLDDNRKLFARCARKAKLFGKFARHHRARHMGKFGFVNALMWLYYHQLKKLVLEFFDVNTSQIDKGALRDFCLLSVTMELFNITLFLFT